MTLFNNFCAAILAVASACRTAIKDAARIIFGFFAAGTNAAVGFLPTIRRMKLATAFLAVAVAIPLMSACGGGGGGGISTLNNTIAQVEDDPENERDLISQPLASSSGADFTTADGTGSDLVFPVDSALIRSASGNDYTYIYQQDAFEVTRTTVSGAPVYEVRGAFRVRGVTTEESNMLSLAPGSGGNVLISQSYVDTGGNTVNTRGSFRIVCDEDDCTFTPTPTGPAANPIYPRVPATFSLGGTTIGEIANTDSDFRGIGPGTPTTTTTTIAATVHVSEFDTEGTNAAVATVVSALQTVVNAADDGTGLASATVTIAVKGARDISVTYLDADGENAPRVVEAYFFETQYSALAWWIQDPREFFLSTVARDPAVSESEVFYFGLQTPANGVPNTGMATYSGVAAGQYLRNLGTVTADRFFVSGAVTLEANFAANGGISGTADLTAYGVEDLAPSMGTVTVQLTDGTFRTGDESATFDGDASIMGTPTGEFLDLAGGAGTFEGYFTGPGAEEAVGGVEVETDNDELEFGFLTRQVPSGGGN